MYRSSLICYLHFQEKIRDVTFEPWTSKRTTILSSFPHHNCEWAEVGGATVVCTVVTAWLWVFCNEYVTMEVAI